MKLKTLGIFAVIACIVSASSAFAQTSKKVMETDDTFCGRFYLTPEVLGFFPTKNAVKDSTFVGMRAGYDLTPHFAMELESGWVKFDIRHSGEKLAELENVPILLNARYNIMGVDNPWDLFVLGGLGVGVNSFSVKGDNLSGKSQSGTFAAQLGGGVEYRFTEHFSLAADVRYYWNDPRARVKMEGAESDIIHDIDSKSFVAGGSLTYKF